MLPELDPAAYSDKDLDELCGTLESLENAVAVLGSVFPLERGKLKTGKRAQKLIAACKKSALPKNWQSRNPMSSRLC